MSSITLPVSLGEALDKLTILDIKLQKIKNVERRNDVQKEYNTLYVNLKEYLDKFPYHYRILKDINLSIWETQDIFHGKDTTPEQGAKLCQTILKDNDRRFRVKAKINTIANSELREQKGYDVKKALIYTHLGLGDMFWMNGAVRYLSTIYDEVHVICKERNMKNALEMYADDQSISLIIIQDDSDLHPWPLTKMKFEEQGYTVYGCGFFTNKDKIAIYNLPNSFYDDLDIPIEIRQSYFYIPRTQASENLFTTVKSFLNDRPYIVIHQQSSNETIPIYEHLRAKQPNILILDLNYNHYPKEHPDYQVAESVVNKPLLDYSYLIENAEELHFIESSIYCLASHLDLSRVKQKVCYNPWGGNAERLGIFQTGPKLVKPTEQSKA